MTSVTEHRIPATDLHRVVLSCPTCRGELAVDLVEEKQRPIFRTKETADALVCPLCKKPFPGSCREAVASLWDFYDIVKTGEAAVAFRVAQ